MVMVIGSSIADDMELKHSKVWNAACGMCVVGVTIEVLYLLRHLPINTFGKTFLQIVSIIAGLYHAGILFLCSPDYEPAIMEKTLTATVVFGLLLGPQLHELLPI
ncbi:hypothetical protein TIFTF001_005446 [Ficus carica]|uniref:Uncharacterized protein n=1 Tax=Ficus carica TaxID=3494 RepID=A0AA88DER3_FICCA|nr:hypothetical protein TIFTF001_005446 [Ficus carica]